MTNPAKIRLIRLTYLFPSLSALLFLVVAGIPHLFFQSGAEAYDTLSLFNLLDNTIANCREFLSISKGTPSDIYFSYVMMAFWILSWICIVLFLAFALFTAVLSAVIWNPGHRVTQGENTAKKVYRLLVFNRGFYVVWNLLPVFPALFPYFLKLFYKSIMNLQVNVHSLWIVPDFVIVLLICLIPSVLFLTTLNDQKEQKMDLFRLFKSEKSRR